MVVLAGCRKSNKAITGFWTSYQVLLDGKSEVVISDSARTDYRTCPYQTAQIIIQAPTHFNLIFKDDGQYAIYVKFDYEYNINYCWRREKDSGTIKFTEKGVWAKQGKNTIILLPTDSLSFLSPKKFPYTCEVIEIKGGLTKPKTLQLKCNAEEWGSDPLNDGDINYELKTVEITARAVD